MNLASFARDNYELEDGEAIHRRAPETFAIPDLVLRDSLSPGQIVKLIFCICHEPDAEGSEMSVERMWVIVEGKTGDLYEGVLDNDPLCECELGAGDRIRFQSRHVIDIYEE